MSTANFSFFYNGKNFSVHLLEENMWCVAFSNSSAHKTFILPDYLASATKQNMPKISENILKICDYLIEEKNKEIKKDVVELISKKMTEIINTKISLEESKDVFTQEKSSICMDNFCIYCGK